MQEKDETGKVSRDGWWKHKDTGAFVHLVDDPDYGVPLTNAYERAGYLFISKEDPRPKAEPKVEASEVTDEPTPKAEPKVTTKK